MNVVNKKNVVWKYRVAEKSNTQKYKYLKIVQYLSKCS